MRSARTFATGAAIAATLLLGGPAVAFADGPSDTASHEKTDKSWEDSGKESKDAAATTEEHGTSEEHGKDSTSEHAKPHGGVHTGGGGLALSGGGAATGAVLLAGGIGISAYALRRRRTGGAVGAAV
ncbi:hypothetical protein [Kitasatospora sp. NPDC094015]|uniref:hypothetical protein n=1 Tax=Kitasatospora sp. NPDC094015 TaxID=3155205 RepID=UPI00332E4B23